MPVIIREHDCFVSSFKMLLLRCIIHTGSMNGIFIFSEAAQIPVHLTVLWPHMPTHSVFSKSKMR